MAKPKDRCNGICSPTTIPSIVRECCCKLADNYNLTSAIHTASELFYRLSGRQQKYAGCCINIVYPCKAEECSCGCSCVSCGECTCELDTIYLPGVCEIVRVTVNGNIIDPKLYAISGDSIVGMCGYQFPVCQQLGKTASPLSQYELQHIEDDVNVRAYARQDGCWNVEFDSLLPVTIGSDSVLELTGEDGWVWTIPYASLTYDVFAGGFHRYVFCPSDHIGPVRDALYAAQSIFVDALKLKPTQPFNTVFTLEKATVSVRNFFRLTPTECCDDRCNTFEIVYKTGCCVAQDIQAAVAELACEVALARCGDETCRLPQYLRSATLDGSSVERLNPYMVIDKGLTGIPSVDQLIKSLNPNMLYRRGRVIAAKTNNHRLRRFK